MCPQPVVDTNDTLLKLRINKKLKARIMDISKEKNKTASELTRLLWQDYFNRVDKKAWEEETKNW